MKRILPYPILFALLLGMWLLLWGSVEPGQILLGVVVAMLACLAAVPLDPPKPRLRRLGAIVKLAGRVAVDVLRSNVEVMILILSRRQPRSAFVRIPLAVTEPNALAILAGIVTATPGSAWVDYDKATGTVIIHVFDTSDGAAWSAVLKRDYESLLLEIFQ